MLTWATFADQLSSSKPEGQQILNLVRNHLMSMIENQDLCPGEKNLCWKILIVGWELFARSSLEQIQLFRLALKSSCEFPRGASEEEEHKGRGIFETLLQPCLQGKELTPIELFYNRFCKSHASFYELETLSKSTVVSYLVVIEAKNYIPTIASKLDAQDKLIKDRFKAAIESVFGKGGE